jgi:hypothetical protein
MLELDVLTAYVICGAGSLVCAAMPLTAHTTDAELTGALRLLSWAFAVPGLGLSPLVGSTAQPGTAMLLWAAVGTQCGC